MNKRAHTQKKSLCARWIETSVKSRIKKVERKLLLAAFHPEENREHVHQLRVATRQAMASVEFFSPFFAKSLRSKVLPLLKEIRKAAGDARDIDVFLDNHKKQSSSDGKSLYKLVRNYRKKVQDPLLELAHELHHTNQLEKATHRMLKQIRWKKIPVDKAAFSDWIRSVLKKDFYNTFADKKSRLNSLDDFHRFRLSCKELRYTFELLSNFGKQKQRTKVLNGLAEIQDRLGQLNDLAVACKRLSHWEKKESKSRRKILKQQLRLEQEKLDMETLRISGKWFNQMVKRIRKSFERYLDGLKKE